MLDIDPTAVAVEPLVESDQNGAGAGYDMASAVEPPGTMVDDEMAALVTSFAPMVEEPSELGDLDAAALGGLGGLPLKPIPLPIVKRRVSGRYRSSGSPFQIEVRVDIDGPRPTMRVSADYYSISGATVSYFGSMRVDVLAVAVTPTLVTLTGTGSYTWAAGAPRVRITIPRVPIIAPQASATLQHLTTGGTPAATYICAFASSYLRSVLFEQDRQDTVPAPFVSYNTGSLPSGGAARTLSVVGAYAEARIEMQTAGVTDVISTAEAGNGSWSDAELHAAMVRHFSLWRDIPQWAVWLFHAQLHDLGPGLLGIMFDQTGRQRQGAAVFYSGLAGATADKRRLQLYTCTHELGHCFNLLHSWQKSLATPPVPNRPGSLSWMNYPWRFPGGEAAYWSGFAFQFDDQELLHIRHGFRNRVIMGGDPFATNAQLAAPDGWHDPIEDRSGLRLTLSAPRSFRYGEPVAIDLELSGTDSRGRLVSRRLRPRNGGVEIAIRQPSGRTLVYRPLLHQCAVDDTTVLTADTAPVTESAFIHYGRDGFYFDTPGIYRLRARTVAADGSIVLSNVVDLRVSVPATAEDDEAAGLLFGDEQGTLMYLVGSDLEQLQSGNDALSELRERFPDHPLAQVARVVQGVNAAREFKNVAADGNVTVRAGDPGEAATLLDPIVDVTAARKTAARLKEPDAIRRAISTQIRETVAPDAGPQLGAYLKARRREIAVEIGETNA